MANTNNKIRLYIAEEQQILREAYHSFFPLQPTIEVADISEDTIGDSLVKAVAVLQPQVMLLGIKVLQPAAVEKLEMVRENRPEMGIVLLSAYYNIKGLKALREFSQVASTGCAYLLKHTIDKMEQLTQVIHSVAEGRIIMDPLLMEGLMATADSRAIFLKELAPREMEILNWMAKGYHNNVIGEMLGLDPKGVEGHIENIYGKLGQCPESKLARVRAIVLYLKATGQLTPEEFEG